MHLLVSVVMVYLQPSSAAGYFMGVLVITLTTKELKGEIGLTVHHKANTVRLPIMVPLP